MSTLNSIFLVLVRTGVYSDKHAEPVRAFDNREDAEREAKDLEIKNAIKCGVVQAHERIMFDWEEKNPAPKDSEGYTDHRAVGYKAWSEKRSVEHERVAKVLDLDRTYAEDYFAASVCEVPMGFLRAI